MRFLFFVVLLTSFTAQAQWKNYSLTSKGDTINREDMRGWKQGPWIVKVPDLRGERGYEEEGYFYNNKKEGLWKQFSLEGDLIAIENYSYGMKSGRCTYYSNSGEPLREESWRAIDPKSPYDTIAIRDVNDPSKILRMEVIKVEPNSYKHGTWTYYNTVTGGIERTEDWVMNRPRVEVEQEEDDLAPIDVSDGKTTAKKDDKKPSEMKKPQAILDYEKKNAGKKKIKVRDGRTGG